jgi:hypothetical protein
MATQQELLDQDKDYQDTVGAALLAAQIVRTETDASDYDFVIAENNLVTNSANKLPTQRSVKQYVDHPATHAGTVASGSTVVEWGDFYQHTAVITVNTTLGAIAGGASLGLGKKIYDLPAGACIIDSAYMSIAITQTQGHITADTPEIGLGTVVASGAVAVLSGTATFENILTGQVAADCDGTATVKTVADQVLVVETGSAHSVYLNVADGWAASGDAAALLTGTVVLRYKFMA